MDYETQRRNMVESQVRPSDVTDRRIIEAMAEVPREAFVPEALRALAYADGDIKLSPGADGMARALLAPRTLAKLLQLASIEPGGLVLDVGSGCGYTAAVMGRLGAIVMGLECDAALADRSRSALSSLGGKATVLTGPLSRGYPEEAPYDAIVLEGAVPEVPAVLLEQLKDGGRLVGIVGGGYSATGAPGKASVFLRQGRAYAQRLVFDAAAGLLPGFERVREFTF